MDEPDILKTLPAFTISSLLRVAAVAAPATELSPFMVTAPPVCVYDKTPFVEDVGLLICPFTYKFPPDT